MTHAAYGNRLRRIAPVVAILLSLRGRNEIDELLFAVHVELPIDIAPVGDGRSFRYYQFFLNAREGVALRKNDENLEFSRGQAAFEGDVLAFRYERMVVTPLAGIGLGGPALWLLGAVAPNTGSGDGLPAFLRESLLLAHGTRVCLGRKALLREACLW